MIDDVAETEHSLLRQALARVRGDPLNPGLEVLVHLFRNGRRPAVSLDEAIEIRKLATPAIEGNVFKKWISLNSRNTVPEYRKILRSGALLSMVSALYRVSAIRTVAGTEHQPDEESLGRARPGSRKCV
jgi:hypothetical protein